jgi:hypothetical protein
MRSQHRATFFAHGRAERVRLERKGPGTAPGRWWFLPERDGAGPTGFAKKVHRKSKTAGIRRAKRKRLESLRDRGGKPTRASPLAGFLRVRR